MDPSRRHAHRFHTLPVPPTGTGQREKGQLKGRVGSTRRGGRHSTESRNVATPTGRGQGSGPTGVTSVSAPVGPTARDARPSAGRPGTPGLLSSRVPTRPLPSSTPKGFRAPPLHSAPRRAPTLRGLHRVRFHRSPSYTAVPLGPGGLPWGPGPWDPVVRTVRVGRARARA